MKKILRDNKGSISALVVISVLLYSIVLTTAYMQASGMRKMQIQSQILAKAEYEKPLEHLDEIRDEINGGSSQKNTKKIYPDGTVWIPEGFKIADDSASTIQGGVVIEDKDGNQFVWIPVDTIADYKRTAYKGEDITSTFSEKLPEDEKNSVTTYKGFYIGRYEAGDKESTAAKSLRGSNDVTKTVTIKKGQAPYNFVTKAQAISLAEDFGVKQGYTAKTKLVSSYAWDTTIAFIQQANEDYKDYGSSSPQGNYKDTTFNYTDIKENEKQKASGTSILVPTGQTESECNIFDLGGNVWELTTESSSNTTNPYTQRGGGYKNNYSAYPAGLRRNSSDSAISAIGFRIALFM